MRAARARGGADGLRARAAPTTTCATPDGVDRALADGRPDVVIHLAAVVGGIGANRENPGRFFHDNAVMGIQLMEEARLAGVEKFVTDRHRLRVPEVHAVPFREEDLWDGYPEETNAPYGLAKKMLLVQGQAYREQYGFDVIHLMPVNLYGPGDNFDPRQLARDPGADQEVRRGARGRARPRSRSGARAAPSREFLYVDDAAEGIVLAAERYDAPSRSTSASGHEITIRDLVGADRPADRLRGRDPLGRHQARRSAAPGARHGRAASVRVRRARRSKRACGTIEWYGATRAR